MMSFGGSYILPQAICVVGSIIILLHHVNGQNINSRPHVESLIHMEAEMVDLSRVILREEALLHNGQDVHGFDKINAFLESVEPLNRAAREDITGVADDVMSIYVLKRRLSRDWLPILGLLQESELVKRVPLTLRRLMSMRYVIEGACDVSSLTIKDILRLQHFYKLRPEDLVGAGQTVNLEADDIALIVSVADAIADHQRALQWIQLGLNVANDSRPMQSLFLNLKARIYLKTKQFKQAESVYSELANSAPESRSAESNLRLVQQKLKESHKTEEAPEPDFDTDYAHYLCRGNVAPKRQETHKCYTQRIVDLPEPLRIEELHDYPRLVLIRGLLPQAEVSHIVQSASEEIENKIVDDAVYRLASTRLRKSRDSLWLQKMSSALLNATFQGSNVRREDVLSRITVSTEGAGGLPDPVVNQRWMMRSLDDMLPIGNYILFLNDVTSGGGLAFPGLHLKVDPEEGAVLFWQFKPQWGPVAPPFRRYLHCPVMTGSQWLAKVPVLHHGLLRKINF